MKRNYIEITSLMADEGKAPADSLQTVVNFTLKVPGSLDGHVQISAEEGDSIWVAGREISSVDSYQSIRHNYGEEFGPNVASLEIAKVTREHDREVSCALVCLGPHPKEIKLDIKGNMARKRSEFPKEINLTRKYPIQGTPGLVHNPVLEFVKKQPWGSILHPKQVATNELIKQAMANREDNREERSGDRFRVLYIGSDDCANLISSYQEIRKNLADTTNIAFTIMSSLDGNDLSAIELINDFNDKAARPLTEAKILLHEDEIGEENFDLIIDTFTLPWATKKISKLTSKIRKYCTALKKDGNWILVIPEDIDKEPFHVQNGSTFWKRIYDKLLALAKTPTVKKSNTCGWILPRDDLPSEIRKIMDSKHEKSSAETTTASGQLGTSVVSSFSQFAGVVPAWGSSQMRPPKAAKTSVLDTIMRYLDSGNPQSILLVHGQSGWGKTSSVATCLFSRGPLEVFLTQGKLVDGKISALEGNSSTGQWTGPIVVIDEIHGFESNWGELRQQLDTTTTGRFILIGKEESNPTLFEEMLSDQAEVFAVDVTYLESNDYSQILNGFHEARHLSSDTRNHILEILAMGTAGGLTPRDLSFRINGNPSYLAGITPDDVDRWVSSAPSIASTGFVGPRFQYQATLFGINYQGGSQR